VTLKITEAYAARIAFAPATIDCGRRGRKCYVTYRLYSEEPLKLLHVTDPRPEANRRWFRRPHLETTKRSSPSPRLSQSSPPIGA
jgi:hypothetical protein